MDVYWIISLYFREILFCEYEIHLTFHTYQTKQTDIVKQWQLIMVSLQLKPDIILGFIFDFYLTSLQLVLCSVAAVKRLPVYQP